MPTARRAVVSNNVTGTSAGGIPTVGPATIARVTVTGNQPRCSAAEVLHGARQYAHVLCHTPVSSPTAHTMGRSGSG